MGVDRLVEEGLAQVTWLPFELHPDIPPEGISRDEYFGPNWRSRGDGVRVMAAELGLTMKTRDRLINTRKALATAEFGRENGKFEQVHRALFEAHWQGTAKLEEVADLTRIAAAQGLDATELERALDEGRYEEVIDANRREAMQVGINAIPAHIFGMRYLVVGAHPYELLKQVAEKVRDAQPT